MALSSFTPEPDWIDRVHRAGFSSHFCSLPEGYQGRLRCGRLAVGVVVEPPGGRRLWRCVEHRNDVDGQGVLARFIPLGDLCVCRRACPAACPLDGGWHVPAGVRCSVHPHADSAP